MSTGDGSLGGFQRSPLGAFIVSPFQKGFGGGYAKSSRNGGSPPVPWEFFMIQSIGPSAGQYYTNVDKYTPLISPLVGSGPVGGPYYPNSNNPLLFVLGTLVMTSQGWYDFNTGNWGTYTESTGMNPFAVKSCVRDDTGTIYCLYNNGSSGQFKIGTTTDGKLVTHLQDIPTASWGSGSVPGQQVSPLSFDGSNLVFAGTINRPGIGNRIFWNVSPDGGITWNHSSAAVNTSGMRGCWIDYRGNQYIYHNGVAGGSLLYKSSDYFSTFTSLPTSNLTDVGSTFFNGVVAFGDGVKVMLFNASSLRVIYADNSNSDIVPSYWPCVSSDRASIYAYNGGIFISTDFISWTQITTETWFGIAPTFKHDQVTSN